jgi:hypothetical protein
VNWSEAFSFCTTLVMEVLSGSRLEVLWELGESTKKKKVRWGAIVTNTSRRTLTTSPQSAMIRYDAMHGYDATDSKVIFINSTVLEESEGRTKYVRHLWRWIETTGSESGRNGISISTAQPADVFNPDDVHNAVNIELTGAGEYSGLYSAIRQRVETLECQVRGLTTNLCSQKSLETRDCARTLLFARHKLGVELEKHLPGTSLSLSKYRDAHTVSQNCMSVQTDCTLAELEGICKMTTSAVLDGIMFHPRIPHYNSGRVVPTYTITFQRYTDLCKILGVTCTEDVTDTLMKIKKEKRNNAPILIRLLGCLRKFSNSNDGPMVLAVGHGCNPPESEGNNPLHVLFRKSQVWDPVEGSFAEPLTTTTMSASEIMALCKGDDSASANSTDSMHMEGKDSFTLKWMRTSPPTERVFEAGESNKILGVLEVSVPYVLFRGLAMCAEVATICNQSFIERST